jgi:hypothetical protein
MEREEVGAVNQTVVFVFWAWMIVSFFSWCECDGAYLTRH